MEADLDPAAAPAAAPGEPIERGRYAIYQSADGGIVIPRASGLCETCSGCTCGTQQEPLRAPAALVKMARTMSEGKGGPAALLKMIRGSR